MPVVRLMTAFVPWRALLVGGQGNGAHAVGVAGVLRLGGEELVLGDLADGVDAQPGLLDRRAVVVLGGGGADAGRPWVGVAGDRLRQRAGGDDVGHREPAARARTRAASAKTRGLSGHRFTTPLEMTTSNAPSSNGRSSSRPGTNRMCAAQPVGLGALLIGHVDAGDLTGRPDQVGGGEGVGT
jgi:hypothetical protein